MSVSKRPAGLLSLGAALLLAAVLPQTRFFPQDLQEAGYTTAFVGKWHVGEPRDDPRPGFDRWVSFEGQGVYEIPRLNADGERRLRED